MQKIYIKLARRVFAKNKQFFFFNLANLSLGIVCGIVVLLYLLNYSGYDKHHVKHSRIYRVGYEFTTSAGKSMKEARSSEKIGPMLKYECPEVESFVRVRPLGIVDVKYDEMVFAEEDIMWADTSIFNIFTHDFIKGNPGSCLEKKNSVVLVNSMAKKYFGDIDPIGKIMKIDSGIYEVTGVIRDLPDNVHLKFSAIIPFEPLGTQWFTTTCYTYLLVYKNANVDGIYEKYPGLFEKHMSDQAKIVKADIGIILEPLAGIHFNSDLPHDFPGGNKIYAYIFAIVGLFIVVISSINYINMSIAFSSNKAKEIGIRKIFGVDIRGLRIYFLLESVLLTMISFLISLIIVRLIIDSNGLYQVFNMKLHFRLFENFNLYIISLGLAIFIGLFSGLYPAIYLSSISMAGSAASGFERKKRSSLMRKSLIVFQFILSLSVLVGVFAMNKQINYVNNKDLGYNPENLIVIPVENMEISDISIFKENLLANPGIISVSTSYILPNSQDYMCNFRVDTESGFEEQLFNWFIVGYDYFKTMEIPLVEGREFSRDYATDANTAYIVNESFLKHCGWDYAVDKKMQIINGGYFKWPEGKIIGVVKDFNIASLHEEIQPMIFVLLSGGYLHVRINGTDTETTIKKIDSAWSAIAPDQGLDYSFMNDHLSDSYLTELNQFRLVKIFSLICIILSCLGLIGLSAYTIARRTREVAIRKHLGASIFQIIMVLYKEIAVLILIAILIAIPLSCRVVDIWLNSFAYRIQIGAGIVFISCLIGFLIAFISVLYHSIKVAYINPVESLKYE